MVEGRARSECHEDALCIDRGSKERRRCPKMAVTWSIENNGSSPSNVFVVFMGSFFGIGEVRAKDFFSNYVFLRLTELFWILCHVSRLGEAEVCMAEN